MRLNIGLLYLSLHNQINKTCKMDKIISREQFFTILGKHFLVPKNIRDCEIKEMILMGLIKKQEKGKYEILEYDLNIEEDANKFYQTLELF